MMSDHCRECPNPINCGTARPCDEKRIAALEAEKNYWKGYVHFVDNCLEAQEEYEAQREKNDAD